MPVNDKIVRADYNNIRSKINNVLGAGSADRGYGQLVRSSDRSVSNRVTVNEWGDLRFDIINAYKHIFGTTPTLSTPTEGQKVRYSTTFTPETTNLIDAPVTQYDQWANTIDANRFTVHPSQASTFTLPSTSTTWPGIYGSTWTIKIQSTVTATFADSKAARYFFNIGGEIRFASSQSEGSGTQQVTSWRSILSTAGTQGFGGNKPGTGTSPATGQNYYRLTNTYQVWYSAFGSSPYGTNNYRISARTPSVVNNSAGIASTIDFLIEYIDNYVDPGNSPNDTPNTVDAVDGTFSLSASYLFATGVLEPLGAGSFTVPVPTLTVGQIAP
jgi:hypothetical protein